MAGLRFPTWWDSTAECTNHNEICPLYPKPDWLYYSPINNKWTCRMCKKTWTDEHELGRQHCKSLDYMRWQSGRQRAPRGCDLERPGDHTGAASTAPPPVPPPPGIVSPASDEQPIEIRLDMAPSQIELFRRMLSTILAALPPPDSALDAPGTPPPGGDVGGDAATPSAEAGPLGSFTLVGPS